MFFVALLQIGCGNRKIIETYDNGAVHFEYYQNANGEKEGHYISYYENGNKRSEGEYEHALQSREWKNWGEEGALLSLGGYDSEGKQTGEWLFYYPSGIVQQRNYFVNGLANGRFVDYFESGKIKRAGSNRDELMNGWDTTFFENGQIESIGMWENGYLHGPSTFFAMNGGLNLTEIRDDGGPIGYIFVHDSITGDTLFKHWIRWGVLSDSSIEYKNNKPFDTIVDSE